MWSRTKIVYVNGNISYSPATCIAGAQGQQGAPGTPGQKGEQGDQGNTGATGKSVSSIIPQYAMTTSKTTAPTTGWTTTAPTWIEGRYIWTRSQINWTNPTSTTYTTPVVDSALDAVTTKYSDLQIKVDGIQSTVSRIDGDYATNTKVTQLADQWTQTTNLANGHTGQISNLGDQINLRLTQAQVDASILSDKTIKDTRNDNQTPAWYYANHPRQTVQEFKTKTAIGLTQASGAYAVLTTEVSWNGTSGGAIEQTAKADDGVYQRRGTSTWSSWSKVADTSNVLAQINLSSEGVQIQGKKVQITGETYIANGVFKTVHIADAAITDVKIANATISSGKIVNLDVDKLSGNKTNFIQSNWNAINSFISIDGEGINLKRSNGEFSSKLLSDGIQIWGANNWAGSLSWSSDPAIVLWAKRGHTLNLGYQGENPGTNQYNTALKIDGQTGLLTMYRDINMNGQALRNSMYITGPVSFDGNDAITISSERQVNFRGPIKPDGPTNDRLRFNTTNINGGLYASLRNETGRSGIAFGGSGLQLIHDGDFFPFGEIAKVINALKGRTIYLVNEITPQGTISSSTRVSL